MKTIRLDIDNIQDPEKTARDGREAVMKLAQELELPAEALKELEAKIEQTTQEFLRDGAKKTSARSILGLMKDIKRNLSDLSEGYVGLAKGTGEGNSFALGLICADMDSARMLVEAAHSRLRDMLDAGVFDKKPEETKAAADQTLS